VLGVVLGVVARLWLSTLRVHVEVAEELRVVGRRPWVLSFFHGTQWPLLAWKRRKATAVMVSLSRDGQMQARALGVLGMKVVRGSTSRAGARGLVALVRAMRRGLDTAFAVDGPRGPYGEAKPGALLAAERGGGVVVPMGGAAARASTLAHAWDRFHLAWPFSRVVVVLGAPLPEGATTAELGAAIRAANARAKAILASWPHLSRPTRNVIPTLNAETAPPVQRLVAVCPKEDGHA
jgi:lysophospholipid acyltransferase (LPLAT)-like uncharacterized protein